MHIYILYTIIYRHSKNIQAINRKFILPLHEEGEKKSAESNSVVLGYDHNNYIRC